jgi:hypothetical protein
MPMLVIRPLIFTALFFALSTIGKILVSRFLPELLEESVMNEDSYRPGSRINILEDDSLSDPSTAAQGFISGALGQVSSGAKPDDSEENLGDISDLSNRSAFSPAAGGNISGGESIPGIDQNAKERYTENGGLSGSAEPDFSKMFSPESSFGVSTASQTRAAGVSAGARTDGGFSSDDTLPDLDSMAGAFMSDSSDEEQGTSEYSAPSPSRRPSSNKAPKWTEDFNAKEIAMGLRTALSKDKEG